MKFFGVTYVVRKDEKLLYRGKDAAQAERIAAGNARNGSASVYEKRGNKEILHKEYTHADFARTHPQDNGMADPVDSAQ